MKRLRWNAGIKLITFGSFIRKEQLSPRDFNLRWNIGKFILKVGYFIRGEIPMRTYRLSDFI